MPRPGNERGLVVGHISDLPENNTGKEKKQTRAKKNYQIAGEFERLRHGGPPELEG
jgi:hypothetical protein